MDRAAALAALDRRMLEAFSRRTTDRLREALPLRIGLPRLEPFLAVNVAKEVRKDALVIRCAGEALAAGTAPGPEATHQILEATKAIDAEFLRSAERFPVRIEVSYERIAPLRLQRIERGLDLSYRVLRQWRAGYRLRELFARTELERRLAGILDLYIEETLALSHSVRLPALLGALRARLARALRGVMSEVATELAREIAAAVHRRERL